MSVEFKKMDDGSDATSIVDRGNNNNGNKSSFYVLYAITGIACLIALIAVIIAAVAVSKSNKVKVIPAFNAGGKFGQRGSTSQPARSSSRGTSQEGGSLGSAVIAGRQLLQYNGPGPANGWWPANKKIWSIAVGHDYGAHEYIDKEGYLQGFFQDLIPAVCSAAGIDCRMVRDSYTNCWDSKKGTEQQGGKGLLGGWYDACTGWYKTLSRTHVFKFSQRFLKQLPAHFYVKKGKASVNLSDVKRGNMKIGFLDGWANDEKCLIRYLLSNDAKWKPAPDEQWVMHYSQTADIIKALDDGTIDAAWAGEQDLEAYTKKYPDGSDPKIQADKSSKFQCQIDGNGMMMRKDNDFNRYWNAGFNKIVESGKFKEICKKANDRSKGHGWKGMVRCAS